ncbi:threonine ammonia-lyase [Actinotalea fermentans]|uniref:threonine ammonia-lyase n=1 Tax=Actinotalea fermentans TaxID=43671 RepID=A0A511YWW3_9CELL|nr:threonine ammonia-lyase [Actinotalea fermentans]KGM16607.1 threonine dehydratase [Actinotalea fermentans ATCC 43279 = JCM 9966 = DSM 3133]GEN79669.1 threonine ammonia-lyase [Actinotalea fermentans]
MSRSGPRGPVGPAEVAAAATVLADVVDRTPVLESSALSALAGGRVVLKCENLQRAGSFKIRGAYLRMSRLSADERARGVVAASAGNHAQGVALAARLLGVRATVFMPDGASLPKIAATSEYGAEVVLGGVTIDDALVRARAFADETGAVLIHPFDHPDVVAGQGTVGLEILAQVPDVRTILVPVGGGGLAAGIAAAVAGTDVQVIGVQAAGAAAWPASLAAGHPVPVTAMSTMADGIAVGCPGDVPFAVLAERHAPVCTVSEEDLSRALLHVAEKSKLLVEPAGAAGVAALIGGLQVATPAVVVLSGGNIDPLLLLRVVRHGLASAGRYLQMRVRITDRPGALAGLLAELAASGGNVMHVSHVRTAIDLGVDEVEIEVQVETRGPAHCTEVVARLTAAGFRVREA